MSPTLIVKNTFICAVDSEGALEALSPVECRRRAHTAGEALEMKMCRLNSNKAPNARFPEVLECSESGSEANADSCDTNAEHLANLVAAMCEGGEASAEALAEVFAGARELAFDQLGACALQRALDFASPAEVASVSRVLRGEVCAASRSAHAHHVLSKLLHCMASEDATFIAEELLGQGSRAAANVYGYSVLCRLLEYTSTKPVTIALIDEVIAGGAGPLCCHKFGHAVAMSILTNGLHGQRAILVSTLRGNLQRFARHRFASQVLEHVLVHGLREERDSLASELIRHPSGLANLACHCFGIHVVRALVNSPTYTKRAMQALQRNAHRMVKDKYGLKLVEELKLQVPPVLNKSISIAGPVLNKTMSVTGPVLNKTMSVAGA